MYIIVYVFKDLPGARRGIFPEPEALVDFSKSEKCFQQKPAIPTRDYENSLLSD
jgi:hypothetical protein